MGNLEVEPDVKQLFVDVLKKDPASRPTARDLLQKPVITSAHEYGTYFDECYDSEDAVGVDSVHPLTANFMLMENDVRELSHISSSGHPSLNSCGDVVGELPQFQNRAQDQGGSQDSGVGGDLEKNVNSSLFGAQTSMRSSSSGSVAGLSLLLHQDSGLDRDMSGGECTFPGRPGE